jgi:GGDEF domain-containing protein
MQLSSGRREQCTHHSVLVTVPREARDSWAAVFAHPTLAGWAVVEADSLEKALFALQLGDHDVWLVDDQLCQAGEGNGLSWLTSRRQTPVLILADPEPARIARLWHAGCEQWLPHDLGRQPDLLEVALRQAVRWGETRRQLRRKADELRDCRQRVNQLADMLWASVGTEGRCNWLTQHHLMLRLQEEIDRAERHGSPLTLVVGELSARTKPTVNRTEVGELTFQVASLVNKTKRRCDVVGQYGPNSFLMLLVQTPGEGATVFCRRLRQVLHDHTPDPPCSGPRVRLSVGLAAHVPGTTPTRLLSLAEQNLDETRRFEGEPEPPR